MSTENREVAYLKDKPLSEDYSYVYGELEDGSIVKVSKEQLGIEQIKESVSELNSNLASVKTKVDNSMLIDRMHVWDSAGLTALDFQLYKENSGKYRLQVIAKYGSTSKTIDLATW